MKKVFYLLVYLIFFVALPFGVLLQIKDKRFSFDWPGYLSFYVFFVSPFLFPVFYKLAKPKDKKEKILFILLSFIIPFVILYIFLYFEYQKSFNPSFL